MRYVGGSGRAEERKAGAEEGERASAHESVTNDAIVVIVVLRSSFTAHSSSLSSYAPEPGRV